ncbi:MAG: archaeosortase/exosortase family protein, partial [bacterium]
MTSKPEKPSRARWLVLFSVLVLLASWIWANLPRLAVGQNGVLTFFLGSLFALLLVSRKKLEGEGFKLPGWGLACLGGAGFIFAVVGIIVPIHQLEWLGVLIVLYTALAWALPRRHGKDLVLALFLVYWIHPLPSQLFAPLQLGMQWMSVKLSEALLQFFNVRVWGDGFVLRTAARVFGVPEACSGMKTAVTVLFCGLGVGLLMRLRGWTLAGLLLLGMVQVLALNVIRISGVVWMGMDKPADWNDKVLHDTMGIFLLLAVALIHLDAALINQWLTRRRRRHKLRASNDEVGEDEDKRRRWPDFWRIMMGGWPVIVALLVVVATVGGIVWRQSPRHRAEMIRGVAEGLMATGDQENAQRAIQAGLVLEPGNDDLLVNLARIKINRGKQEEGLRIIRRKPMADRGLLERILEIQALLDLKRLDEAAAGVAALPKASYAMPGVALVLAQFNAILDRPDEVARHVVKAARGMGTQEGIRNLFPYMASRDLWDAIRQSDSSLRYALPVQGMIAVEAHLRVNDRKGAAEVLRRALKDYEREPMFFRQLIRMAHDEWPGSEWSDRFESLFLANLGVLKPTELTLAMEGAFYVGRPQLGWLAYRRLMTVAPDDPMLLIAPAEHGRKWFQFDHGQLGVASTGTELIDAKPFYQWASTLPPWKGLWDRIPLAEELGGVITKEGFQRRLKLCLEALEKMEAKGKLDFRLQMLWGRILGEFGRWDEAHDKLRQFEAAEPRRHRDFRLVHAELYKAHSDWESCFESLSEYVRVESHPPLTVWIDLANTAMSLDLGAYAMGCMEEARKDYPESEEWSLAMAAMWSFFGYNEEALHVVSGMRTQPHSSIRAKLLMETGRVVEGQKLIVSENLPDYTGPKRQSELLPPAEWTLEWRGGRIQEADYEHEKKAIKERNVPFLKRLNDLKLSWYEQKGQGRTSDYTAWEGAGRDSCEKA